MRFPTKLTTASTLALFIAAPVLRSENRSVVSRER
jgi:hypothetical protein